MKPFLQKGMYNSDAVEDLQQKLNLFLPEGRKIKVDGDFGGGTELAVMYVQKHVLNVKPNGMVGEFTHKKLDALERKGGFKPAAATPDAADDDDAKGAKQEPKASRGANGKKTALAEPSTEEKDDEPKKKSGKGWNPISWVKSWFSPKKVKAEESASERDDDTEVKPTPKKQPIKPSPQVAARDADDDDDDRKPAPKRPATTEKPAPKQAADADSQPTNYTFSNNYNANPDSSFSNLNGQLSGIKPLAGEGDRDGVANPISFMTLKSKSGFGPRIHPKTRRKDNHTGVDISAPTGTPVRATMTGVVEYASGAGYYGNLVKIQKDGPDNVETRYAHLSRFAVHSGERVEKGEIIGYVGMTGRATGPHLHYEVRIDGVSVDPRLHGLVMDLRNHVPDIPKAIFANYYKESDAKLKPNDVGSALFLSPTDTVLSGPRAPLGALDRLQVRNAGANGVPPEKPPAAPKSNWLPDWMTKGI